MAAPVQPIVSTGTNTPGRLTNVPVARSTPLDRRRDDAPQPEQGERRRPQQQYGSAPHQIAQRPQDKLSDDDPKQKRGESHLRTGVAGP
jgi:hypothetical protein